MRTSSKTPLRTFALVACAVALVANGWAPLAFAAGTGDDPTPTEDVLSPREATAKARLGRESETLAQRAAEISGRVTPLAMDIPYKYLWTPSHRQETGYWCGPATCQIIHDYFGSPTSQRTYGGYMRTTANGTDFTLVDDCLRYFTGKPYYYFGSLAESTFNARVADSLQYHGMPLAADLNIISSIWPNYMFDHVGHIVPIEAFDWRIWKLRINDPFDESAYGGGSTYGHTTYDRVTIWNGVYNHFRRAVVSAP